MTVGCLFRPSIIILSLSVNACVCVCVRVLLSLVNIDEQKYNADLSNAT